MDAIHIYQENYIEIKDNQAIIQQASYSRYYNFFYQKHSPTQAFSLDHSYSIICLISVL